MPSADKSEDQKAAEAAVQQFKDDLGPFVVAAETTRMAMVFTDATVKGNPIIFANDSFCELTGYRSDDLLGEDFASLLAHADDERSAARIRGEFEETHGEITEILLSRKDRSEFWAALFVSPVRDEDERIVQHFASLVDLTRHKDEQAHAAMLINELNHRVKNTLATVQSMVRQALRSTNDPAQLREVIESRLIALSRSHDLLSQENWRGAGLRDLIGGALEPYAELDGRSGRFAIEGENIRLSPRAALALGIATNELATNAMKYGALSIDAGAVGIAWEAEPTADGQFVRLRWQERDGPPVAPPIRRGFGSRAIEQGLAQELNGEIRLDFAPDGLICTMDFPVPTITADG